MKKVISIIAIVLVVLIGVGFAVRETVFPIKDKEIIEKYAKEYNVKPELIAAIINFETGFDKDKYKDNEARGLMRITEQTGERLAKEMGDTSYQKDSFDQDDTNIKLGTYYLSKSNGKDLKETVGNWALVNGKDKDPKFDAKKYAEETYTDKIKTRETIYKVLYFMI